MVPADGLLNLPPHPAPPPSLEVPVSWQAAADCLKSTYQIECRARCQRERERFAGICRDAEQELAGLERAREERLEGLTRLAIARTGPVRHLATALVVTAKDAPGAQLEVPAEEADLEARRRSERAAEDLIVEALVGRALRRSRSCGSGGSASASTSGCTASGMSRPASWRSGASRSGAGRRGSPDDQRVGQGAAAP